MDTALEMIQNFYQTDLKNVKLEKELNSIMSGSLNSKDYMPHNIKANRKGNGFAYRQ